jgi:hypothetical protein
VFFPHAPYVADVPLIVEGPEFDATIMCEGGEKLTSRRYQGASLCIEMACRSILLAYTWNL